MLLELTEFRPRQFLSKRFDLSSNSCEVWSVDSLLKKGIIYKNSRWKKGKFTFISSRREVIKFHDLKAFCLRDFERSTPLRFLKALNIIFSRWHLPRVENNGQSRAASIQDCSEVAVIIANEEDSSPQCFFQTLFSVRVFLSKILATLVGFFYSNDIWLHKCYDSLTFFKQKGICESAAKLQNVWLTHTL